MQGTEQERGTSRVTGRCGHRMLARVASSQDNPHPMPSHQMICFCRPRLSEVEIHVGLGPAFMPVAWPVCFHRDYQNIITEKSPRGRCRGHFRQASVSGGKFSIKARGGHLPYLCPMPPWHSPQGKDRKEDRRDGGREASLVLRRCPWWL